MPRRANSTASWGISLAVVSAIKWLILSVIIFTHLQNELIVDGIPKGQGLSRESHQQFLLSSLANISRVVKVPNIMFILS
ncbi:hypothetical protein ACFLWS_03175 [Chloroflexota bacterium]